MLMEDKILEQEQMVLPAMAMRGVVVFPDEPLHFDVGREKSVLALKKAVEEDRRIFLVTQKEIADEDPDMNQLYKIGVVATIEQMLKGADNAIRVLVSGAYRARLVKLENGPYLTATVEPILEKPSKAMNKEKEIAYVRLIKEAFSRFANVFNQMPKELENVVYEQDDLESLIRLIINQVPFAYTDKQQILEENSLEKKAKQINIILERETEIFTYENDMYNQVRSNIDERQREIFLREQLRVISEQLGEYDPEEAEASEYEQKIVSFRNMSDEIKSKLLKEVDKLNKMPSMSQEAAVVRGYLDTCLEL